MTFARRAARTVEVWAPALRRNSVRSSSVNSIGSTVNTPPPSVGSPQQITRE
jgi:hypothetical protein